MSELHDDRSADQAVIARLRSALDEVAASAGADGGSSPLAPSQRPGIGAGRWLAIAAAAILVVGAATALVINRRNAPETASTPSEVPTTQPAPTTAATEPTLIRTVTPWYTLIAQDLAQGEIQEEAGDPTSGALTMAWARTTGPTDGLLVLTELHDGEGVTGDATLQTIDGGQLAFGSYGVERTERESLAAHVMPGSGLPYVLPVDGWQVLAMGRQTFFGEPAAGQRTWQEFSNDTGVITLSVGDYTGQFSRLLTGTVEATTVAGQTGWIVTDDTGTFVLWPAGDSGSQWATLEIPAAFGDRIDGLIAGVVEVDPTQPTVETVPVPDTAAVQTGPIEDIAAVTGNSLPLYDTAATDPAIGAVPPALELVDGDGQPSTLLPGESGPALVVFLAEWCPHCQAVLPLLQQGMADGTIPGDEDVVLVVTASARDDALAWLAGHQWEGRVLLDAQAGTKAAGQAANAYGAPGWPFWVAVGADGTVVSRTAGELDKAALQALVTPLPDGEVGTLTIPAIGFESVVVRSARTTTAPHLLKGPPPDGANTLAISMLDLGPAGAGLDALQAGDQVTWTTETGTYGFVITRGISCTGADCGTEGAETLVLTTDGLLTRLFATPAG